MSHLFLQARIINPEQQLDTTGSIRVGADGRIETLVFGSIPEPLPGERVIDMSGKVIAPGFFDMHCHFREPGQEYKETLASGAAAAAAGGYTGVALMPNTRPAMDSPLGITYLLHHGARLPVDLAIIGAMTLGSKGEQLAPFGTYVEYGLTAISDDGGAIQSSQNMRLAFEYAASYDLLLIQHCEDRSLTLGGIMNEGEYATRLGLKGIPDISESLMLSRDLQLLRFLETHKLHAPLNRPRYHVAHISTKESVELVRQAKQEGLLVSCEVTPHHFTLCDADLFEAPAKGNYIMKPPLASRESLEAIREAIADGTIDAIATDHAPHAIHEKECPPDQAAFGIIGLETAFGLTMTQLVEPGLITLSKAVELLATAPRTLLRRDPVRFSVGAEANFALLDPEATWLAEPSRFRSKSSNSPFIGTTLKGKVLGTFFHGALHLNDWGAETAAGCSGKYA